jgi:hypothetical protein
MEMGGRSNAQLISNNRSKDLFIREFLTRFYSDKQGK